MNVFIPPHPTRNCEKARTVSQAPAKPCINSSFVCTHIVSIRCLASEAKSVCELQRRLWTATIATVVCETLQSFKNIPSIAVFLPELRSLDWTALSFMCVSLKHAIQLFLFRTLEWSTVTWLNKEESTINASLSQTLMKRCVALWTRERCTALAGCPYRFGPGALVWLILTKS